MSYGLRIGPRVKSLRVDDPDAPRVFGMPDILPGWRVVDVNDEHAGTVVAAGANVLVVRRGLSSLFRLVYAPYRIVGGVRDGVVRITVHKSELDEPGFRLAPRTGI